MPDEPKYPKWKYHPTNPALVVDSLEHENELGAEWVDSPAQIKLPLPAATENALDPQPKRGKG